MGTHPIFESDFDCLTDMAFSKTPRVLITDELSRPGVPGPCDYDPNDASEKRIKGFSIREEDMKKERRQSSGKINYLTKKDTTHIQSKLARSSSVTIPRKQLKGLEKVCQILSWNKYQCITVLRPVTLQGIKNLFSRIIRGFAMLSAPK